VRIFEIGILQPLGGLQHPLRHRVDRIARAAVGRDHIEPHLIPHRVSDALLVLQLLADRPRAIEHVLGLIEAGGVEIGFAEPSQNAR
jgi:hypothetical protein